MNLHDDTLRSRQAAEILSAHVALDRLGAPRFRRHARAGDGEEALQLHERILEYRNHGARERRQRFRERVDRKLDQILTHLTTAAGKDITEMKTIQEFQADMQARLDKNAADVAANTSLVGSVRVLLEGQSAAIKALRDELEAAKQAGGDASVLDPLLAAFDAQIAENEARQADLAAAVVANTPQS